MKSLQSIAVLVAIFLATASSFATDVSGIDAEATLIKEVGTYANETKELGDGTYLVAARTNMTGTKARMVRWWFADYLLTTDHYKMWHPEDHVWMDWENKKPGEIIGASHLVHEYIGEDLMKLRIQFVDPSEFFGNDPNNEHTFVICARVGDLQMPIYTGKMCHTVIDTDTGAEMRSRFWLGHVAKRNGNDEEPSFLTDMANTKIIRGLVLSQDVAHDLMIHAQEEMSTLGKILPDIYPMGN